MKTFFPKTPTIMIVEDDADSRFMMRTLLEMKGYRVMEAQNGEEAIAAAEAERPGLILMDLQLPRLNGFAVTRHVRQHELLRETPIIIISGHEPTQHRKLALAAGCNEYLHKPIDFNLLEETLCRLLPVDENL
jgi:CheY-like chemotaxis protein